MHNARRYLNCGILHPHHHSAGLQAAAELWALMITLWDAARHWRQHSYLPTSSVLYRSKKTTTMFWIKDYHQRWRLHRHITCCLNTAHTAYSAYTAHTAYTAYSGTLLTLITLLHCTILLVSKHCFGAKRRWVEWMDGLISISLLWLLQHLQW